MELRTSDLAARANISPSYASEILSGKRKPSRSLAVRIFEATGWRHESIASLTADELALLAKLDRAAA